MIVVSVFTFSDGSFNCRVMIRTKGPDVIMNSWLILVEYSVWSVMAQSQLIVRGREEYINKIVPVVQHCLLVYFYIVL